MEILYNNPMVGQLNADVVSGAATLQELIDDTNNKIVLLQDAYQGQAPAAFQDAAAQVMASMQDIRDVMHLHGTTIADVQETINLVNQSSSALFG